MRPSIADRRLRSNLPRGAKSFGAKVPLSAPNTVWLADITYIDTPLAHCCAIPCSASTILSGADNHLGRF
jgi:hypothetical protein